MPAQRFAERLTRHGVPHPDGVVIAPARDRLPVWAKGDARDKVLMPAQRFAARSTRRYVPHADGVGLQAGYFLSVPLPAFFLPHGTRFPFLLALQSIQPLPLFLLNHPRRPFSFSALKVSSFIFDSILELPQLAAPTLRHLTSAPEA